MIKSLSSALFRKYPVWKWDGKQEGHEPVLNWQPLLNDEPTLFIKASFTAADGTQLDGYLVGLDTFYAIGIFVGNIEYVLNFNLPDMIDESLRSICKELDKRELKLFPLIYETEVAFEGNKYLTGVLSL